jgi:hypothetical protein
MTGSAYGSAYISTSDHKMLPRTATSVRILNSNYPWLSPEYR